MTTVCHNTKKHTEVLPNCFIESKSVYMHALHKLAQTCYTHVYASYSNSYVVQAEPRS